VVANVDGKELRRMRLPGTPDKRFTTRVSHRALVFTTEGDVYLVDGDAGSAQKLELPPEEGKRLAPNPSTILEDTREFCVALVSHLVDQLKNVDL
jgi:hypothetical protein